MWGIPVAFVLGYAAARYFGDNIKNVLMSAYKELESIFGEWL